MCSWKSVELRLLNKQLKPQIKKFGLDPVCFIAPTVCDMEALLEEWNGAGCSGGGGSMEA